MNILLIGTTDIIGGAARISWSLKENLEKAGHTVSMFVADKKSQDSKVKVIQRSVWRKILGFLLASDDFINTDWILKTEEFKNADIVHCHNLHGRFFGLSTLQKMSVLKPVVWTLHDEWALTTHCAHSFGSTEIKNGLYVCPSIDIPPRLLWDNTARLSKRKQDIYNHSKLHIVTPSRWLMHRLGRTVLATQDTTFIPNGIKVQTFSKKNKLESRKALGLPEDKKIVLFLADDAKKNTWKGWTYCEEIIADYKNNTDVLFLNVGNREQHKDEPNVIYRGEIRDDKVLADYYNAADILLFTSIAENFPLVILEAMSCGLPIVSFDVGGVKEVLIHGKNGYVAKYQDPRDLAAGVSWLLEMSGDKLENISRQSSEDIRNGYNGEIMFNRYMELYKKIYGEIQTNKK